jgi:membrane-associated protease RseP (regulator of RpoE activity)
MIINLSKNKRSLLSGYLFILLKLKKMIRISKWLPAGILASTLMPSFSMQAQNPDQNIRINIDAHIDGEHIKIDTTIDNMEQFNLDAYLKELGLEDEMGELSTLDIRIEENDGPLFNMDWLENDSLMKDMQLQIEQIDIPELPEMPAMGSMMFFNQNKAFLGVVTENTPNMNGVVIKEVMDNSAASAAGLQTGDILTMIDGKTVESTGNLIEILSAYEAGATIQVSLDRNGEKKSVQATLSAYESYFKSEEWEQYGQKWEEWGADFEDHMEEWGKQMEQKWEQGMGAEKPFLGVFLGSNSLGAEVTGISEGSAAEAAGLQKGDIITAIDNQPMEDYNDVAAYVQSKQGGDVIQISLMRNGQAMTVPATLQVKQTEMMFRFYDDADSMHTPGSNRMFFFHPNSGNCNAYAYEGKDQEGKKITMNIEIIKGNEEPGNASKNIAGSPLDPAQINFFPNPNNGQFSLQFQVSEPSDVIINIRDLNGAMVYEESLKNFSGNYDKNIQLGNEAVGTYFINVVTGDYIVTKQIVIQ